MDFDDLIDFLDSDDNEFGLSSIATHGFLTASIVGKPLHNWQTYLFEGHEKQVKPEVLSAIEQWRDELQAMLQMSVKLSCLLMSKKLTISILKTQKLANGRWVLLMPCMPAMTKKMIGLMMTTAKKMWQC